MIRALLGLLLALGLAAPAVAQDAPQPGLTVQLDETWIFTIKDGQPADARKAAASDQPAEGEIKATLTGPKGRTLTLINNSPTPYNYQAFTLSKTASKGTKTRVCTLMSKNRKAEEVWEARFAAIRIADFVAVEEGRMQC